jgi:hypothetical protein
MEFKVPAFKSPEWTAKQDTLVTSEFIVQPPALRISKDACPASLPVLPFRKATLQRKEPAFLPALVVVDVKAV